MLNEEVAKYRELSGDTNPNTPISRIGGYLDGYEKALEQEPNYNSISAELNGDAISRQAAIDEAFEVDTKEYGRIDVVGVDAIDSLPSVTPQPKTGHWTRELIRNEKGGFGAKMICSECGNDNKHDEYMNYCPNCGCRMVNHRKGAVRNE